MKQNNIIHMAGPDISQVEVEIVMDALKNGWYGESAYYYCELFQKKFAEFHNRKYAIMTPNCTTSIHLLLSGLGIKPGDEIIVPECTWIGSSAAIKWLGAKTIFCDIEKESWCLSPESVLKNINSSTKAIIAVNLFGNMANMKELEKIASDHNLFLIEDAAESLGSTLNGVKSGKFGIGSVFSFHRTKTITTGEGGMLLLDDEELWDRCMFLRDHGRSRTIPYYIEEVAYKYMPFNLQAALGYAQFLRIDELLKKKKEQFNFYKKNLEDIDDIQLNPYQKNVNNSYWITGLVVGKKYNISNHEIMSRLSKFSVPSRPFFYPLSSLPAYNEREKYEKRNKVAYDISSRGINLPGAANLTKEQMKIVCDGVKKALS
jgi:perosamine synthetase